VTDIDNSWLARVCRPVCGYRSCQHLWLHVPFSTAHTRTVHNPTGGQKR